MAKILISFLILVTSTYANANKSVEVQTAIQSAEAYNKACEKHSFRPYREKKFEEVSREDYFKLTEVCPSYDMASMLKAVQNINKLEKENIEKLSALKTPEKIKNVESRLLFLTNSMLNTPLSFGESLIFLVALGRYKDVVDQTNDKNLKTLYSVQMRKLKERKSEIYERTIQHDMTMVLAESRYTSSSDPKEIEEFRQFISNFLVFYKSVKENLSCLSKQKCKICGDNIEKTCSTKKVSTSNKDELNLRMLTDRYAEATENFFKRLSAK